MFSPYNTTVIATWRYFAVSPFSSNYFANSTRGRVLEKHCYFCTDQCKRLPIIAPYHSFIVFDIVFDDNIVFDDKISLQILYAVYKIFVFKADIVAGNLKGLQQYNRYQSMFQRANTDEYHEFHLQNV